MFYNINEEKNLETILFIDGYLLHLQRSPHAVHLS